MDDVSFRIRAHRVVAQLNPCHEDNYYLANGMLSWGGAPDDAIYILRRATECRIWDETPAFFYGFNLWFFRRDVEGGRKALELAAERTVANAAIFRRMAVMIEAETYRDERAALRFLEHERDQAADEKLKEMLDRRVQRLAGLIGLRDAQARYEAKMGRRLAAPVTLVEEGFLSDFPKDPLGLGYEFVDGEFRLRSLKIPGMEDAK
ncbi:hypothetical protein CCZ27_01805 [Thauera sinica]|nr:hypothetical protein CCZ27_01805 [Thauera sp. K11]